MQPRVRIAEGTAFEVLLGAAAVADPNWREVFACGPGAYESSRATLGEVFVDQVAAFGRYGWINLIGLLPGSPEPWDTTRLIGEITSSDPEDVHVVALGGARRQLLSMVEESVIRSAVRGDRAAQRALTAILASDDNVLEGTEWLVTTSSEEVHGRIVDLLEKWRSQLYPAPVEDAAAVSLHDHAEAARARLDAMDSRRFLDETIGGLHYDPAGLDEVLAVSLPGVAPVVVVVDGLRETVILHPPVDGAVADAAARLLELGRAVGDRTRIGLVSLLGEGERTAVELAAELRAPRTTLLHHLAILRSAGLVHVTVTPGGATTYRLRAEGFARLAAAAQHFISTG